ncbi:MAG: DUF3849 domain-containing protein, partial [Oscillibacter sp.]|nr:DUF3849 domain-containing protein [Oscillibacter sp.]
MPDITAPMFTALDQYPMPDPAASPELLALVDCPRRDLLPVSQSRALDLLENMTVYAALSGGVLDMPMSCQEARQYPPETVFAVPKREWEASMEFHTALNERMDRQIQRERAFLRHEGDCFAVYQLRGITTADIPGHIPLERARLDGLSPLHSGYQLVYTGAMSENMDIARIHRQFTENRPADFHHRQIQVHDIIVLKQNGELKPHYINQTAYSIEEGLLENVLLFREGKHGECLPFPDEIPVYHQTGEYAQAHGELDAYLDSYQENIACRDAIDDAVSSNHKDSILDTKNAVRQVVEQYGYDRMFYVLAFSIQQKTWDGRISRENINWAERIPIIPDVRSWSSVDSNFAFLVDKPHSVLLDMFVKEARRSYQQSKPLSAEEITAEAERIVQKLNALEYQNGPGNRGFVTEISPSFVGRANEGDLILLSSMMPFKS